MMSMKIDSCELRHGVNGELRMVTKFFNHYNQNANKPTCNQTFPKLFSMLLCSPGIFHPLPGLGDFLQSARVVHINRACFSQIHGKHLGRDDRWDR